MVHEFRLSGQLARMEPHLLPEQRHQVVELIQSVDRLAWADQVMQASVTNQLGRASARAFDRSQVANIIGVFSRDVKPLRERIEDDSAVVTIQVADRLPLHEVHLVRRGSRWLITTDQPIDGLARELRNLADAIVAVAREVEKRPMSVAELKRELNSRTAPIERRLSGLVRRPSR